MYAKEERGIVKRDRGRITKSGTCYPLRFFIGCRIVRNEVITYDNISLR